MGFEELAILELQRAVRCSKFDFRYRTRVKKGELFDRQRGMLWKTPTISEKPPTCQMPLQIL
jgi:hypothetical protein